MAKNLKLKIKNTQIAAAVSLSSLKDKLDKKKEEASGKGVAKSEEASTTARGKTKAEAKAPKEPSTRVRARSRSAFSETAAAEAPPPEKGDAGGVSESVVPTPETALPIEESPTTLVETQQEQELIEVEQAPSIEAPSQTVVESPKATKEEKPPAPVEERPPAPPPIPAPTPAARPVRPVIFQKPPSLRSLRPDLPSTPVEKLGPTGRHVRDLLPVPKPRHAPVSRQQPSTPAAHAPGKEESTGKAKSKGSERPGKEVSVTTSSEAEESKKGFKTTRFKEYQDLKPARRQEGVRSFDARDRQGLRDTEEEQGWRRRRAKTSRHQQETATIRPTTLSIRLPISIKDLAAEMKLKASQLLEKLFLQGTLYTINDFLDDETTVQLLGQEFSCEISIDTTEEERIRVTGKSIKEEIGLAGSEQLKPRPPVVAFMGHVDHGKTSLIDAIRKSNRAAGEAGAITQHIGAFRCHTAIGDITVLDTPGHEAFSAMRARGADVTDIVVLVIAGDEGMRQQTIEAIQHAKAAKVTIVVALNKCDKPNFNAENVYRQLAEQELLPEVWGGQTITVNCSAVTGEGVNTLLEMLALQSEVLELRAQPDARARGRVLESEMHKGMGATATVLVQNGTLRHGDALVFDQFWGRVKTMRDDLGHMVQVAQPSTPVEITGLSGLPEAGQEFIVVSSEKEAREIAEVRMMGFQQNRLQQTKRLSMESLVQQVGEGDKKILNLILLADVQGSLEALQTSLKKIQSNKVVVNVISTGVGEISESDVQLALTSKAVIIGFHSTIESHAESLVKQSGLQVRIHDIIYHAIDDVKELMAGLLDRIALETEKGKAEVLELFKSSQLGIIAGCRVTEGSIARSHQVRVRRGDEIIWKGSLASLKRVKEDVREVLKGLECGIVLQGFKDVQPGDILETYEVTYIAQEL